jgi:hypothetical protein
MRDSMLLIYFVGGAAIALSVVSFLIFLLWLLDLNGPLTRLASPLNCPSRAESAFPQAGSKGCCSRRAC